LNENLINIVGMNYITRCMHEYREEEVHDADREGDDEEWDREMVCANTGSARRGAGNERNNAHGVAQKTRPVVRRESAGRRP
jgi:hypothetical protein